MTDPVQALAQGRRQVQRNAHLKGWMVLRQKTLRQTLSRNIVLQSEGQQRWRALRESLIASKISAGRLCDPPPRSAAGRVPFGRSLFRRNYPLPMAGGAGEQLVCRVDRRDGHVVIRARGVLSVDTTAALAEALAQGLSRGHAIIDLRGVTEVDASGYRELERWQRHYRERGDVLVLAGPSPQVGRLLRVLHLDHVIFVFPTVSEAEEAVTEPIPADRSDQAVIEPVQFAFSGWLAPGAERLAVVGSFNGWDPEAHPMAKTATGDWTIVVHLPPGRYLYNIWVDGVPWLDPQDDGREPNTWGTEYSVRYIGRPALGERVLKPIRGGAQMALECHSEQTVNAVIVRARGEIDLSTIPILEAALRGPLENGQHLIVDLTAVRYIDSTGLHTLLRSEEQLREKHLQVLVVAPPSALIRRVFQISAVDKVIRLFPTLDEAMHSLRPDPSNPPP